MQATIKAKFISCAPVQYEFKATEGRPASTWSGFKIYVFDEDAFSDKDKFFAINVKAETATKLGMEKATFEKENLGRILSMEGILTTRNDGTVFTLLKIN